MPKVNSVGSLLQLSIAHIVTRIENFDFPANSTTKRVMGELGNLFHQLPSSLLEQVVVYAKNGRPTDALVLEYLISTHLRFARFHVYTERCITVFPRFEKLISLVLRFSAAGNNCLRELGIHCKNLRILDIHQCLNVTNDGIRFLCFNSNDDLVLRPSALCNTLQHFLMYSTSVTKRGTRLAIKNLSALKTLHHESTFEVLVELMQKGWNRNLSKISDSFSHVHLSLDHFSPYIQGSLGQVVQLIPSLTCVVIFVTKGLNDTDLLSLLSLKNLTTFHLNLPTKAVEQNQEFEITFKGGVVPLLRKFGHFLESLDISFFTVIDIWTVFKFCPNLTLFWFQSHCDSVTVLSESEIALYRNNEKRLILKNLVVLVCGYNTSPKILHFLFSFPALIEIEIIACDALTDEFLQSAVSCHEFNKNVQILNLSFCHYVTKRGIDALMTNHNCVEEIRIKCCENLTHENAYEWHLQAKKENFKLNIRFITLEFYTNYRSNKLDLLKYV